VAQLPTATYSFRASDQLAQRIRHALEFVGSFPDLNDTQVGAALAHEIQMGLARAMREPWVHPSDVTRGSVELVVAAIAKVGEDLASVEAYRAWDEQDEEGRAMRRGVARLYGGRVAADTSTK
jgi:hypothetical protein